MILELDELMVSDLFVDLLLLMQPFNNASSALGEVLHVRVSICAPRADHCH
jgi:hypothetical protein